jgi:flagellar biogenesis protein FliO
MRLLITLWGACLFLCSAGLAAENPIQQAGGRQWPGQSAGESRYPTAEAPAVPANEATKSRDNSLPGYRYEGPDVAPDPPAARKSEVRASSYEQEPGRLAETLTDKAKAFGSTAGTNQAAFPGRLPEPGENDNPVRPAGNLVAAPSPSAAPANTPSAPVATPAAPAALPAAKAEQPATSAAPLSLPLHSDKSPAKTSPLSAMITVGGSLAFVLGLFFVVAWTMRKTAPRGSLLLPAEVFEILGRAPLGARQQVQLLRCGNKLLLVSIMPGGTETLTEVTDPLEVDRIAGVCRQAHPKSATVAFRQVFQQLAPKTGQPPALDAEPAASRLKRYRWEEKHA